MIKIQHGEHKMNYLAKMYGRKKTKTAESAAPDKNPNRVSGGLKAQGGDHFTMIAENGMEQQILHNAMCRVWKSSQENSEQL